MSESWILDTVLVWRLRLRLWLQWSLLLPPSAAPTERHRLDLRRCLGQRSPPTASAEVCRVYIINPCQCQLFLVVSQLLCKMFPITCSHTPIRESSTSTVLGNSGDATTAGFDTVTTQADATEDQDGPKDDEYCNLLVSQTSRWCLYSTRYEGRQAGTYL